MSGATLIEKSIESKMNSDALSRSIDSQADLENYVRLSFGRNNPMMHQALAEGRISEPVMLQIKLEVVSVPVFDSLIVTQHEAMRGSLRTQALCALMWSEQNRRETLRSLCKGSIKLKFSSLHQYLLT